MSETRKRIFPRVLIVIISFSIIFLIKNWFFTDSSTYWYENGNKRAQGNLLKGKEEGMWKYWYEDGTLESIQVFREGLPDSIWTWYFPDGTMKKRGAYEKGTGTGEWTFYHPNGEKKSQGIFKADMMEGLWQEWYPNGTLKSKGNYEGGVKEGLWKYWNENGKIESEGTLSAGKPTGKWHYFFESGDSASVIVYDSSGTRFLKGWTPDGTQTVTDGEGILYEFYPGGLHKSESHISGGVRNGPYFSWYEDGKRMEIGNYENGNFRAEAFWTREGKQTVENGTGNLLYFFQNDNKGREGRYENGLKQGEWQTWLEDGAPYLAVTFVDGVMEGPYTQYHPNGNIHSRGTMKGDKRVGTWTWYWPNGEKQTQVEFQNGRKTGVQKYWSESGQLIEEEQY